MKEIDHSEVEYYTNKFLMKMNGCKRNEAKDWVEGAALNKQTTMALWNSILKHSETVFTK